MKQDGIHPPLLIRTCSQDEKMTRIQITDRIELNRLESGLVNGCPLYRLLENVCVA